MRSKIECCHSCFHRCGNVAETWRLAARNSPVPIVGSVVLDRQTIDETYYPAIAKGAQAPPVEPAETI